jgi:ABC-type amino acid transport system permease subunit
VWPDIVVFVPPLGDQYLGLRQRSEDLAVEQCVPQFVTAVAMLITSLTGVELEIEQVLAVILPVIAYIFGEAWVDSNATRG